MLQAFAGIVMSETFRGTFHKCKRCADLNTLNFQVY